MDDNHEIIAAQSPPIIVDYRVVLAKGVGYLPIQAANPLVPLEVEPKSWRRFTGLITCSAPFDFIIYQHNIDITGGGGGAPIHTNLYASGADAITAANVVVFDRTISGKYAMFRIVSGGPNLLVDAFIRLMPIAQ